MTAVAPVAWGSTYVVTHRALPADSPLWGATLRALPAGLVLMLIARRLPQGAWWWRSVVLGTLNVGAFFVLIYVAAQALPSGVASSVMAAAPVAMMLTAWALVSERPTLRALAGAATGIVGVTLIVGTATGAVDPWGVAASVAAMLMSSFGFVLAKRWRSDVPPLVSTAWQMAAGGVMLAVAALVVDGAPPPMDGAAIAGFAYLSIIATAVAFVAWFSGLARLPAGTVGVIGLLNPVTGVALGALVSGERLSVGQGVGVVLVLAGIATTAVVGRGRAPGEARTRAAEGRCPRQDSNLQPTD
ncbi:EamA family transporter [Litorihabitans aurantiacus]|uniref:EamA family transporter n=1 Tax=Litorihabitans aurantiacus TaxID=1930061 RepID=UPI0024E191E1|nr:EamA family transporter [Litorihabitans aurantiacus]